MSKIIIRPSSVKEFEVCAWSWFNKHVLKIAARTNSSAAIGTAIHYGAEKYWKEAMVTGVKPSNVSKYVDIAVDHFIELDNSQDLIYLKDETSDEAQAKVATGINLYLNDIAPEISIPSAVEKRVTFKLEHPIVESVSGTIDYICEAENLIGDIKTSKRAIVPSSHILQQSIYLWLANQCGMNVNVSMIYGVIFTKQPKTEILALELNIKKAKFIINKMLEALELYHKMPDKADVIFRGNTSHHLCNATYCPKHPDCEFVGR